MARQCTIFLGTPSFAATILAALIDSPYRPALVITEPDKPVGRKQILTAPAVKAVAEKAGISMIQPKDHVELLQAIQDSRSDLGIVAAYGRILTPTMLALPPYGFINVHASLLPRWRGATPIQAALVAGDSEIGVTLMQMEEGLDTGPIIAWSAYRLAPAATAPAVTADLAEIGAALLLETLPRYVAGDIVCQPQPPSPTPVTKRLARQDGRVTGTESPEQILRMLRAYTPWPGVWLEIDDQRILLLAAHIDQHRLVPDRLQLAGKKPVDWHTLHRDRAVLAKKIDLFLNPQSYPNR